MQAMAKTIAESEARLAWRRRLNDDVKARLFEDTFREMQAAILRQKVQPVMLIHGNCKYNEEEREWEMQEWGRRHNAILLETPEPPVPAKPPVSAKCGARKQKRRLSELF